MKHYLWIFTGAYTAALIVFGIISTFISIGSSSGAPTLMVGGFFTAWHFVKREKRIPTADEKVQLIWGSIACTFIISALLVFIFVLATGTSEAIIASLQLIPMWIWLLAIAFITLIEFAVFYFSYGWFAIKCVEGQNKKRQR